MEYLKKTVSKHNDCLCLLFETKGRSEEFGEDMSIARICFFDGLDAKELARGLLLMWTSVIEMDMLWKNNIVICCHIFYHMAKVGWKFLSFYGTPYLADNIAFWESIVTTMRDYHEP